MITKTLTIKGPHCTACTTLIGMELEDHGLEGPHTIELCSDKTGNLTIERETEKELMNATNLVATIINAMNGYSIEERK